jgi:hypothetical protein
VVVGRLLTQGVQFGQHVPQVRERVEAQVAAGADGGVMHGRPLARLRRPDERPVGPADGHRPQGPLGQVVVDGQPAVGGVPGERLLAGEHVPGGFAER